MIAYSLLIQKQKVNNIKSGLVKSVTTSYSDITTQAKKIELGYLYGFGNKLFKKKKKKKS